MKSKARTERERLCLSCQRCCKEISIYTHPILYSCSVEEIVEFYETRGFDVQRLEEDAIVLSFKRDCPHLTPAGCDIYEERPDVCRKYSGIEDFGDECLWSKLSSK